MGSVSVYMPVLYHQYVVRMLNAGYALGNDDFLVVPGIAAPKASLILASVAVSTALVESSSIRILGFFNSALAIHSLCF